MKKFFLFIFGLLSVFLLPASFGEDNSVLIEGLDVAYSIENGSVDTIFLDRDFLELVITMETTDDGTFEITIPRELLDAKFDTYDDIFFILVDGFETDYIELESADNSRTLFIPFFGGDSMIEIIGTESLSQNSSITSIEIPDWIRNNAGWWADGMIEDSDFVSGIQYLIQKGIMNIPPTESDSSTNQDIPDWIRNNAGWWADGMIEDSDFVSGIQYLIQKGIMKV